VNASRAVSGQLQFATKGRKKALFRLDFAMEEMCFAVNGKNLRTYLKTVI